ncbi:MAG TPA: hypothetical protein VEF76_05605 [Patescibacteria group bacterium]|nr:hypothetical protein [Patescibacteria group bacterium]
MSLSTAFNANPDRAAQLALLEQALDILKDQKAASHENRSMHGELAETRRFIRQWGGDAGDGEGVCARSYPNPRANDIAQAQVKLNEMQTGVIARLAAGEEKLVGLVEKIFGGDEKKLAAFYSGAAPSNDYLAQKWTGAVQAAYSHPAGATVDAGTAVTAVVAKFAAPDAVDGQIKKIEALIDDGKFANTVKRVAWHVGKKIGLAS